MPQGIDPRFAKRFREPEEDGIGLVLKAACCRIWEDKL